MSSDESRRRRAPAARATLWRLRARAALRLLEAAALRTRARWRPVRVGLALCYHGIADVEGNPASLSPPIARSRFERQLRHLRRRYRIVPAGDLVAAAAARRRGGRLPVALTFDDDLRSHLEVATPLLRAHAVPATFFLSGGGPYWWRLLQRAWDSGVVDARFLVERRLDAVPASLRDVAAELQQMSATDRDAVVAALSEWLGDAGDADLLSPADVAELVAAGFEIGFHTRHHYDLTTLTDVQLDAALRTGRRELEAITGRLRMIAYPHGGADRRVADAAAAAGFELGFVADGATVSAASDPRLLGRRYPASGAIGDFAIDVARAFLRASRR